MTQDRIRAGYCSGCGLLCWRFGTAQRTLQGQNIVAGVEYLLWPEPDSVYAKIETQTGHAVGIAFHDRCKVPVGQPIGIPWRALGSDKWVDGQDCKVIGYETVERYYDMCFMPEREEFFRAWLKDALSYDDDKTKKLMETWKRDRDATIRIAGIKPDRPKPLRRSRRDQGSRSAKA